MCKGGRNHIIRHYICVFSFVHFVVDVYFFSFFAFSFSSDRPVNEMWQLASMFFFFFKFQLVLGHTEHVSGISLPHSLRLQQFKHPNSWEVFVMSVL